MPCGSGTGGCGSLRVEGGVGGAGGSGDAPLPVAGFLVGAGAPTPSSFGGHPSWQVASTGTGTASECAVCGNGYAGNVPMAGQASTYGPSTLVCNQGGNARCVAASSVVDLWDGGTKLASELQEGDVIWGFNGQFVPAPQTVESLVATTQRCLRVEHSGGSFVSTASHLLYQKGGSSIAVMELMAGFSKLVASDGSFLDVLGVYDAGLVEVYGWSCPPDHLFVSGGMVHHNKLLG